MRVEGMMLVQFHWGRPIGEGGADQGSRDQQGSDFHYLLLKITGTAGKAAIRLADSVPLCIYLYG
jgi:hypothetical protein